jgi:hypothetical protein
MGLNKKTATRALHAAHIFEDPIPDTIKLLKQKRRKNGKVVNWPELERDLRSVCAEYQLSYKDYNTGAPTAGVASARRQVRQALYAADAAARLPRLMATLALTVFGPAGQSFVDRHDADTYIAKLDKLRMALSTYEKLVNKAVRSLGVAKGRKGPLVDHLIGTPTQRFLAELGRIWRNATNGARRGEAFKAMAKSLIDAFQPPHEPEVGDLDRQIDNSRKLQPGRQTVFDVFTEFIPHFPDEPLN